MQMVMALHYKPKVTVSIPYGIIIVLRSLHPSGRAMALGSTQRYFLGVNAVGTWCLQMNGAVSKVNKKFISHLTRAKPIPLAAATVQVSQALPAVPSLVLTAGPRGQFPRWCRSRKTLSVCSVLRCPDL